MFDEVREQDHLVHHPFYSFSAVETFLQQAAVDPHVVGIKMTLYRIGQKSPLIDLLIDAADAGKQVAVLVELKARFDERNNIQWATRLEEAGVHVVYGVENLKTHCKLCLVVRKEVEGVRRYAHIGTGNYNRVTSHIYTDFGLFTADPNIVDDVSNVFNSLTGYSQRSDYKELLVAPALLRARFMALIQREMAHARDHRPAHIVIKNNAVTDPAIIRALYRAAQAGVEIDMIVRGVCCLRPGLQGVERAHSRPLGRRPFPRALARVLLRERRPGGDVRGQRGPHGEKSRPARRSPLQDRRPFDRAAPARRRARRLPARQRSRLHPGGRSVRADGAQRRRAAHQRPAASSLNWGADNSEKADPPSPSYGEASPKRSERFGAEAGKPRA